MTKSGYTIRTEALVALAASTAKTVLCAIAPASFGLDLKSFKIGFDGSTAGVPVLWELATSTLATNSTPGTNNTACTVNQVYGRSITPGFTGFYDASAEPTALTVFDSELLTPTGGLLIYDYPLGETPDTGVSAGIVLRCTAQANVNVRASFTFERC